MKTYSQDEFINSPLNLLPEIRKEFSLPERVLIHDVTLRDGEQTPGVVFTPEDKLKIAQALDDLGVSTIEAGMPIVSKEDMETIKSLTKLGLKAKIACLCRAREDDIDLALKCDVDAIVTDTLANPRTIKAVFGWDEEKAIERIRDIHAYAKDHGLETIFMPVDSIRADPAFIERAYKVCALDAKVDGVVVTDTYGMALPQAEMLRVRQVRKWVGKDVKIALHIHNDFGLATANSIAAVCAGAEVLHTCVNNLGERAGNAALEEVAVALQLLLGIDAGIRLEKLFEVSRLVEKLSGIKVAPGKSIVGENAFTFESGLVVYMWKACKDAGFELGALPFMPQIVGREATRFIIGKKSGATSIALKLKEMGIKLEGERLEKLVEIVKEESIRRKSTIKDMELREMALKLME
jgi:isopropylmalate/homocitrate/citramalate synthase